MESRSLFVTGATGLLGSHFLRAVAQDPDVERIRVLTRQKKLREQANAPGPLRRAQIYSGDLTLDGLGLTPEELAELSDTTEVWHIAGDVDLSARAPEQVMKINHGGTCRLLELARRLPKLRRFFYVGTAYAYGTGSERVPEGPIPRPTGWKNAYEESKWLGEDEVIRSGLPFYIMRPSIITGHAVTGEANRYTIYGLFNCYARIQEILSRRDQTASNIRIPGDATATKNLIPVDWCARRMVAAGRERLVDANPFINLVNPQMCTMKDIHDATCAVLEIRRWQLTTESRRANSIERTLAKWLTPLTPYMVNHDPAFACERAMSNGTEPPPRTDEPFIRDLFTKYAYVVGRRV